jgi:hypothetical protein
MTLLAQAATPQPGRTGRSSSKSKVRRFAACDCQGLTSLWTKHRAPRKLQRHYPSPRGSSPERRPAQTLAACTFTLRTCGVRIARKHSKGRVQTRGPLLTLRGGGGLRLFGVRARPQPEPDPQPQRRPGGRGGQPVAETAGDKPAGSRNRNRRRRRRSSGGDGQKPPGRPDGLGTDPSGRLRPADGRESSGCADGGECHGLEPGRKGSCALVVGAEDSGGRGRLSRSTCRAAMRCQGSGGLRLGPVPAQRAW